MVAPSGEQIGHLRVFCDVAHEIVHDDQVSHATVDKMVFVQVRGYSAYEFHVRDDSRHVFVQRLPLAVDIDESLRRRLDQRQHLL